MYSAKGHLASPRWGCPIRTSPDQSLLAAPRGFSQPSTSFIGSWCQGIHRAPLLARRLDLSNHQAGRINVLKKPLFVEKNVQHLTRPGGTEPVSVCSTTLRFFRCMTSARDERQSWSFDHLQGRTATTNSQTLKGTKIARHSSSHV